MYTIKEAAARSGVSVQLLRAWERRYGVVQPTRAPSGYRLYDEATIARLRAMRRLIDDGWAASTAAARVAPLDDAAVQAILGNSGASVATPGAVSATRLPSDGLAEAFVARAADLDEAGVERVLDEMFARGSFEQVATELVMPALVRLGDAWAAGRVDVAGEHAAAGAVQRRLGAAFMAAGVPRNGDVVLVGMPPGAHHDLGALTFATAARRAGLSVRYLGTDLPVRDWLDAISRTKARAIVIGAVVEEDIERAVAVAKAAGSAFRNLRVAIGGPHAADAAARAPGVVVLPPDLAAAVDDLAASLTE
jgi:DNA-binding transcriptional MerR regulator/methylmalonyl-CoA mutase cobalamin-binding subunit